MFFHPEDRGEMASMIYNWPADEVLINLDFVTIVIVIIIAQVDAVVVTDGSRVLGKGKTLLCVKNIKIPAAADKFNSGMGDLGIGGLGISIGTQPHPPPHQQQN